MATLKAHGWEMLRAIRTDVQSDGSTWTDELRYMSDGTVLRKQASKPAAEEAYPDGWQRPWNSGWKRAGRIKPGLGAQDLAAKRRAAGWTVHVFAVSNEPIRRADVRP